MSVQAWENIVKQIEKESDAAKIAELAKKLFDAMVTEEREKVKQRLAQLREVPDVMGSVNQYACANRVFFRTSRSTIP